jgi:hypothetical protein
VCRLLSCLGAGQIPWLPHAGFPTNVFDRRRYEGASALALLSEAHRRAYACCYWGSRPQWESLGGNVSGEPVAFLPWGGTRPVELYNLDAVAGDFPASRAARPAPDYARADRLIAATGAAIRYTDEPRAAYHPAGDFIVLPHRWWFKTADAFYGTAFHELAHWTEPDGRLGWYDGRVAVQELRAELASDFLMAELGWGRCPSACGPTSTSTPGRGRTAYRPPRGWRSRRPGRPAGRWTSCWVSSAGWPPATPTPRTSRVTWAERGGGGACPHAPLGTCTVGPACRAAWAGWGGSPGSGAGWCDAAPGAAVRAGRAPPQPGSVSSPSSAHRSTSQTTTFPPSPPAAASIPSGEKATDRSRPTPQVNASATTQVAVS